MTTKPGLPLGDLTYYKVQYVQSNYWPLYGDFVFMLRAGFDSFEVSKPEDADAFADSIRRYDVFYQPTGDGRAPASRLRLGRA